MSRAHFVVTEPDLDAIFLGSSSEAKKQFLQTSSYKPSELLDYVEHFIKRFVVLPDAAYLPLSAWVMGTYFCQSFECFPYLALLSPVKRCGKTRLLEVLEMQVHDPWRVTAPSPAALYRMAANAPTLLLDEIEGLNTRSPSEVQQAILAILNAGHRKGSTIPRCEGPTHTLRHFSVYGPKAFAAIGSLPDTLLDRSIVITMQRRMPGQKVERLLLSKVKQQVEPITEALLAFASDHETDVRESYQHLICTDLPLLSDRDADLWLPLYAICSIAAPERLSELESASQELCSNKTSADESDSLSLTLLSDLRDIWPANEHRVETKTLLKLLIDVESSPWGAEDFNLSARKLARMLRPFGVTPHKYQHGLRGYQRDPLERAICRYLPDVTATSATPLKVQGL